MVISGNPLIHRLLTVWIGLFLPTQAESTAAADVVVYGSTPGGFCAAIGAAREGAKVILVEPLSHVGGMNTGGLSFSNSNQMENPHQNLQQGR